MSALRHIADVLGLDAYELAEIFGVPHETIAMWFRDGVPAAHEAKLTTIVAIADTLALKLRANAVARVARTPAPAYGGKSMLGMLADGQHEALLAEVRASFDWTSSA